VNSPCYTDERASGTVFHDDNGNSLIDIGEPPMSFVIIEAQPGSYLTASGANGNYVLPMDTGSFSLDGQEVLYHVKTTSPYNFSLAPNGVDSLNHIGYQAIPGIYDLVADITVAPARPGLDNNLWLAVNNIGTESTLATISLTFDNDQTWVSSDSIPDNQTANTATWFETLAPGDSWQTVVVLHTGQMVPVGTPILHSFSAIPQLPDTTPTNNVSTFSGVVVASFDPNDKLLEPEEMSLTEVQSGEYIEYTIHFQNTGTAPAERVVITDTLNIDLEWSSMEFISSSHDNTWYLQNGVLHFIHDPIFLPDSNSNGPASHGYVKFRMKPVSTLMAGEQIENVANIYFDFNEPVITDPAIFEVSISTEISELENAGFEMYPNPTNGIVTIVANKHIEQVEVMQLDGRVVRRSSSNTSQIDLDVSALSSGVYLLKVNYTNEQYSSQILMVE